MSSVAVRSKSMGIARIMTSLNVAFLAASLAVALLSERHT